MAPERLLWELEPLRRKAEVEQGLINTVLAQSSEQLLAIAAPPREAAASPRQATDRDKS